MLQSLSALGSELRGPKVAISTSPTWFVYDMAQSRGYYEGNFSAFHAGALAFDTDLSLDLRRLTAHRMLDFPETLDRSPLTHFALQQLTQDSP